MSNEVIIAAMSWYVPELCQENIRSLNLKNIETLKEFLIDNQYVQDEKAFNIYLNKVKNDLVWLKSNKADVITVFDSTYPERLLCLKNPPLILSYFGNFNFNHQFLSIVGSRNPSTESTQWLESEVSKFLSEKDICIVSGGARGVDQKAHSLSIRNNRPTYMFLPSGLASMYPKNISSWKALIVSSGGAIVSQFSPFEAMRKHYFHMRNQIIASISQQILIVDAKRRSGTMMTASYASMLGTDVLVVPNSPIYESSQGGLDLIYAGAQVVRSSDDLKILFN